MNNRKVKQKLYVVKIGGNVIDSEELSSFLVEFSKLPSPKILIHGGGKKASQLATQLNIPQQIIKGRRITNSQTLEIAIMVYSGLINKTIVAQLQRLSLTCLGLCGVDANLLLANHRPIKEIDYGFVGDIYKVNTSFLSQILNNNITPIIAPLSVDIKGQILNSNADSVAQEIATSMVNFYSVSLIYCFEKNGVLLEVQNDQSVIAELSFSDYNTLKNRHIIQGGMLPKLDNCYSALQKGVKDVYIGNALDLLDILNNNKGTKLFLS